MWTSEKIQIVVPSVFVLFRRFVIGSPNASFIHLFRNSFQYLTSLLQLPINSMLWEIKMLTVWQLVALKVRLEITSFVKMQQKLKCRSVKCPRISLSGIIRFVRLGFDETSPFRKILSVSTVFHSPFGNNDDDVELRSRSLHFKPSAWFSSI